MNVDEALTLADERPTAPRRVADALDVLAAEVCRQREVIAAGVIAPAAPEQGVRDWYPVTPVEKLEAGGQPATPYYDVDGITIYRGDCRDVLPTLDLSPSLVLTDPPYGMRHKVQSRGAPGKLQGETVVGDDEPFDPRWLLEYGRCVIFGANYFAHLLPPGGWIIWSKAQDNRWAHGAYSTRSLAEVAWTNCHRYVGLFNCFWAGSPMHRLGEERMSQLHPTQKPVALMRWIIERNTNPGDLVLDPYMGSGPVARACLDLGRRYIGVELEERYCAAAAGRLNQGVLDFGASA